MLALHRWRKSETSIYQLQRRDDNIIAVVADDERSAQAATAVIARACASKGVPVEVVELPAAVVEQLRERRRTQRPSTPIPSRRPPMRPSCEHETPPASTCILGSAVADETTARHLYDLLVATKLADLSGLLIVIYDYDQGCWVVAAVCDDSESAAVARAALTEYGYQDNWRPRASLGAELWALRVQVGQSPLPVSEEGAVGIGQPLTSAQMTRTRVHAPTRRQPCVCGSGRRYKNCCGRLR